MLEPEASVAFAWILFEVLRGATPERTVRLVSLSRPIMAALEAAVNECSDGAPETLVRLGGEWVAEEALALAVYAARVGRYVEHGLQIAVSHSATATATAPAR